MWNRLRESKTRNSRNWFRYENFIHLFKFKGFSIWGERDTIFLCWLLLYRQPLTQPTHSARSAQSRLASPSPESQPSSSEAGTQLTAFSQISAYASGAWRHPNTLVPIPIWDFYFDLFEWHIISAHAWIPALMLHLTNLCTKWKVLILTKPKGKIYTAKSLGYYIKLLSLIGWVWFYSLLTNVGYLMPDPHYIRYVWFGFVWFYGISIVRGYLIPNPLYTYILNIYDLDWFGFMAYQPL